MLAKDGYTIFATVRSEADALTFRNEAPATLTLILLDVTNPTHIEQAYTQLVEAAGSDGLMAVINNGGVNYTTAIEDADLTQARASFEVDFWGMVRVVPRFLFLLRLYTRQHPNKAQIINVSSIGGISAFPYIGF